MQSAFPAMRMIEVFLFSALARSCAAAFDNDRTMTPYAHRAWGLKEGAPRLVTVLAQSVDGNLWLGSPNGLYRFDGFVFEHYQPESGGPRPRPSRPDAPVPHRDREYASSQVRELVLAGSRNALALRRARKRNYRTGQLLLGKECDGLKVDQTKRF